MYCEVIDDKYGLVFACGIWIDGSYLYGSLTYLYGAFQLLCCQFPLVVIFSIFVSTRYQQIVVVDAMSISQECFACCGRRHRSNSSSKSNRMTEITFYVILAVEIAHTICLAIVYDAIAIATSVIRTWSILLNIYLWYFSRKLPKTALRWTDFYYFQLFSFHYLMFVLSYRSGVCAWSGRLKEETENQEIDSNETWNRLFLWSFSIIYIIHA